MQFAEETAIVSEIDDNYVLLETQGNAACSNCASKSGCGQVSSIFTLKTRNKLKVKIDNSLHLQKGDSVVIAMAANKLLLATVLMYLLPLLLLFLFSLIAKITFGETASIVFGLLGLTIGLLVVKKITRDKSIKDGFQPKLIRKIIPVNAT